MRQPGESKGDYERRMERAGLFEAWRKSIPDSRMREVRLTRMTPLGEVELLFCLNCGAGGGAVKVDPARNLVAQYICQACAATHGGLPVPEVPRDLLVSDR
jgi:hypothetical protein